MQKRYKMKTVILSLCVAIAFVSQAQRYEWAKGWEGRDNGNNYISGTVTDSKGNLYVLANYAGLSGGPYVMWDSVRLNPTTDMVDDGVVLACITPQGNMAWRKTVWINGGGTDSHELRMLGDSAVACLFTYNIPLWSEYGKLYYLDTLLRGVADGYPANISGYTDYWRTGLVVFDTTGRIVEQHALHLARVDTSGDYLRDSTGAVLNSPLERPSFDVDADGNVYLLLDGGVAEGSCLMDNERRVGVVEGLHGAVWSPVLLKLSPHLDTLLGAQALVAGNTPSVSYGGNNLKVRTDTDGVYVYGTLQRRTGHERYDTLAIASGISRTIGYSSLYTALLVKFGADLTALYAVGIDDTPLNEQSAEYWQSGNLGSTFREVAFDPDSGLLFVAGDCWQRAGTEPLQCAVYYVDGQPTELVNHAFVLALDMADGTLHSVARMPSLRQSNLGLGWIPFTIHAAGLAVGGNRVLLQGVSVGGVYYPNLYRGDQGGGSRLTMAQFDYAGHVVRGYDFNAVGSGDIPAALAMRDSLLYIANILTGSPRFGLHELHPQEFAGCISLMVDTAFMSPYVYREPEWVDSGSVGIESVADGALFSVYPNPFVKNVKIRLEGGAGHGHGDTFTATLTDIFGRCERVDLSPDGQGCYTLDLSACPLSAYLLTLTAADGRRYTVKLLKQN